MDERVSLIESFIGSFSGVAIKEKFHLQADGIISGKITVVESGVTVEFDTMILPQYPFRFHEIETIRFVNKDLLASNHVNADGSICIHTVHSPNLRDKLGYDIEAVKYWIKKYFILGENDLNYEHIIVPDSIRGNVKSCFLFTEVAHDFTKGEFGLFGYSLRAWGKHYKNDISTYQINFFRTKRKIIEASWSSHYKGNVDEHGLFIFIENPPVKNGRFIVTNWIDLEPYVTQDFLKFLYSFKKGNSFKKRQQTEVPILFGYKVPNNEIHWQCAMIDVNDFPNYGIDLGANVGYEGHLDDKPIKWISTKNCSFNYFFGRGSFDAKLTESKILIVGLGAIGSILATTLTRGGCKNLSLIDYDTKEPENVCRSEYSFITGINDKVLDLGQRLIQISPFLEIIPENFLTDFLKVHINTQSKNDELKKILDPYDVIFDCTADDDVAFILDALNPNGEVISLSITNHARELICSIKPNLYKWLIETTRQFAREGEALYEPQGCWSSTFLGSYNDISLLVQFAIKNINLSLLKGKPLRPFYISAKTEEGLSIKLYEF